MWTPMSPIIIISPMMSQSNGGLREAIHGHVLTPSPLDQGHNPHHPRFFPVPRPDAESSTRRQSDSIQGSSNQKGVQFRI